MSKTITTDVILEKLHQLEINQSFQDETIAALETTVGKQHQQIQLLENKIQLLTEYIKSLKIQDGIKKPEEEVPPPHY